MSELTTLTALSLMTGASPVVAAFAALITIVGALIVGVFVVRFVIANIRGTVGGGGGGRRRRR